MSPGLMKVSLTGGYRNQAPLVGFKIRITRENDREPLRHPWQHQQILHGDEFVYPVTAPAGVSTVTFQLEWNRMWDRFPTSNLDMIVTSYDPTDDEAAGEEWYHGVSENAPERQVIHKDPETEVTYWVRVVGDYVPHPDRLRLFVDME